MIILKHESDRILINFTNSDYNDYDEMINEQKYFSSLLSISFFFVSHLIFAVIDGVVIYPREHRCSNVGGMCVEKDKCRSLVSANGLCPNNQHKGVECCFERKYE